VALPVPPSHMQGSASFRVSAVLVCLAAFATALAMAPAAAVSCLGRCQPRCLPSYLWSANGAIGAVGLWRGGPPPPSSSLHTQPTTTPPLLCPGECFCCLARASRSFDGLPLGAYPSSSFSPIPCQRPKPLSPLRAFLVSSPPGINPCAAGAYLLLLVSALHRNVASWPSLCNTSQSLNLGACAEASTLDQLGGGAGARAVSRAYAATVATAVYLSPAFHSAPAVNRAPDVDGSSTLPQIPAVR